MRNAAAPRILFFDCDGPVPRAHGLGYLRPSLREGERV